MPFFPKYQMPIAHRVRAFRFFCILFVFGEFRLSSGFARPTSVVAFGGNDMLFAAVSQAPAFVAGKFMFLSKDIVTREVFIGISVGFGVLFIWLVLRWCFLAFKRRAAGVSLDQCLEPKQESSSDSLGERSTLPQKFEVLQHSYQKLEQQNTVLHDSVLRLERVGKLEQQLYTSTTREQCISYLVGALQQLFGYEHAGVVIIDQGMLRFYFGGGLGKGVVASPIQVAFNGASIAGQVALSGSALRLSDLRTEVALSASPGLSLARSELAVPVASKGQVLAVLTVQSGCVDAFSPGDEQQLVELAHLFAGALDHFNQVRSAPRCHQWIEVLYRVSQVVSTTAIRDGIAEFVLDQLTLILPDDRSVLVFIDGEAVDVVAVRGFPHRQGVLSDGLRLGELPLLAQIAQTQQALVLTNAPADPRYRALFGAVPRCHWLGVPLLRQGYVGGMLTVECDRPQAYGAEEFQAIVALANQVALAMEKAHLYTEAQERTRQLEVVTYITQAVSTRDIGHDLPGILRTIIHQIRRVVPCDYAAITLYNDDDNSFSVETVYDFTVRDWAELPVAHRVPATLTPWQTACRTGGPLVQTEFARSAFVRDQELAQKGLRSGVIVPIIGANRSIGTLDFASRLPGAYSQTQIAILLELSHYLGTTLHNARLTQEREETATKLARTQHHLSLVDKVRAVGQLASGVAHDFNNLLAGILGNAQLLLLEVRDSEQRELLRIIEQAAKDGAETVQRLQGFARMEHDTPMTEVRLDMLARDAIDLTRPRWRDVAQSHGTTIEINRQLQPVTPIAGRPAELREVLTNLIINAVDALPRGGTITISTSNERWSDDAEGVVIEVADTGMGMSAEVREHIFDPFFTTKGEHGTGLGLAVSLGIIQSHGGKIEVESAINVGTRFIIRLPVRTAEQTKVNQPVSVASVIPGHVLFVESEAMIRDATVRLLNRWGHKVTQATQGSEALQLFLPELYDVVISDLGMPDMNGWDLLAEIKQRDHRVPTILITGWGRQVSDEEARARGVDFIIVKPFDQDDLLEALAYALGSHPASRS